MLEKKSLQQIALDFVCDRTDSSFTKLYNRLRPGLRKFITKYHQDSEIIDEILAITLSKAYAYVDKYDSTWNFSTWIYKICQNECLMEIRRQNSLVSLDNIMESRASIKAVRETDWKETNDYEFFNNEENIDPDCLYSEIIGEIENLPQHYKEIISDRVVDKMKYKEIADKRGLKINTVRSRIHSAKKVIKNLWVDKRLKSGNNKNVNIVGITILQLLDEPNTIKNIIEQNIENCTIIIVDAKYGTDNRWINVTDKCVQIFEQEKQILCSNALAGDPCYGLKKKLVVEYKVNNKMMQCEIKEGKYFNPKS